MLDDGGVGGVDLVAERGEQPEGLVLAREIRVVVMKPADVVQLMEDGAGYGRVPISSAASSPTPTPTKD